jgi:hypothetical protein
MTCFLSLYSGKLSTGIDKIIYQSPISPVIIFFFYFAFFIHLSLSFYAQICYA